MPFPKTITLKDNLKFDFSNPESAIDYLIYITNPINYRLIVQNIILLGNEDAVEEFVKNTTPISYKRAYIICLLSTIPFHNIFMKTDLTFIFQDYLLDDSISELIRKNKLNNLRNNFREILNYISNQIDVKEFKKLDDSDAELLSKKFGEKYKSDDFHHKDNYFTYNYPITLSLFSHNLMLYCIGYRFTGFYAKLLNDYSSFLNVSDYKEATIEKEVNTLTLEFQENPHPRIFINNDAFHLFEKLSVLICKNKRTQLADYSFVFRKLQKDGLIYSDIAEKSFREFLSIQYEVDLDKLKILEYCTTALKETLYNQAGT